LADFQQQSVAASCHAASTLRCKASSAVHTRGSCHVCALGGNTAAAVLLVLLAVPGRA
jgi:hypothetical protein